MPTARLPAPNPPERRGLLTTLRNWFFAGVVVAGYDANKVFIENGRYHGDTIAARLRGVAPPRAPQVSRDLDGG